MNDGPGYWTQQENYGSRLKASAFLEDMGQKRKSISL